MTFRPGPWGKCSQIYSIETPNKIIRDRVTGIHRPDWWPDGDEIREALKPESYMTRR